MFSKRKRRLLNPERNLFTLKENDPVHQYMTMYGTWIHHFTPGSNLHLAEWPRARESWLNHINKDYDAGFRLMFIYIIYPYYVLCVNKK